MIQSAGIVIIHKKEILLVKPKNIEGKNFSIPKGIIEKNELPIDAALRETYEEVGLSFEKENIITPHNNVILYFNNGIVSKKLYYFLVDISDENKHKKLDSLKIQNSEIEFANFYTKEEAFDLIFWRQKTLLYLFL